MFRSAQLFRFFISILLLLSLTSHAQRNPWRSSEMEVKVTIHSPQEAEKLGNMNFKGEVYLTHAWLYVTPDELLEIKHAGFDYEIKIADLNTWSNSFGPALVPPGYYTFNQIKAIADSLATHFPNICKKVIFGYTPQLKELAALKISDQVNVDENEPEIMFDGGIHGNEVGASQNVIKFARDLCLGYDIDPQITTLINNREIWLYYCVNPYGRDNMTRENSNGVDINRDFGYMWDDQGSSPGPFSQPETKALRDCMRSNQFVSYTNFHSGIETISFPWSYRYSAAPDKIHFESLAQVYVANSGYASLPYGQGSQIMYLINGSTKDYTYGSLGALGWSMEISLDKQPLGSQIQYYYNINKPAMLALIEHAGYGMQGTVTDAITGLPISAVIYVDNTYPVFTDGSAGDYHKYLVPGIYSIKVTANGYQTKTIAGIVVNALQCTTQDVQLEPLTGQFAYRSENCRIPGFNPQNPGDEGSTMSCLGPPDGKSYSLGKGGYIMVDMLTPVQNLEGDDITIFEGDASPESFTLYALDTPDGYWNYLGFKTGTSNFDLDLAGLSEAQYFVLLDDNNGTANVADAGFDFDAIKNIHSPIPDTLGHISGRITNVFTGAGIAEAMVIFNDTIVLTDTAGYYFTNLIRGEKFVYIQKEGFASLADTVVVYPAMQQVFDYALFSTVETQQQSEFGKIQISPNPFVDELKVDFSVSSPQFIAFYLLSMDGRQLIKLQEDSYSAGSHSLSLNLIKLACNASSGIYVLRIDTGTEVQYFKVVKL